MSRQPKFPKQLTILGTRFKIKYVPNLTCEDDGPLDGQTTVASKLIEINADLQTRPDELYSTLLHECIHAVLDLTGHVENIQNEEAVVMALENGLYPLIKRLIQDK